MQVLNNFRSSIAICALTLLLIAVASLAPADPCGMVPPIYTDGQSPIVRTGLQQTFVSYRNGVESFVIRPGYEGNIDNFGMLIPFPTPPSIRKVHDDIFAQIQNAVDPPEVVVDLRPQVLYKSARGGGAQQIHSGLAIEKKKEVEVIREEAVGMYEVAVLAAGSAESLKTWMDQNGYQFPEGMDEVTEEYIAEDWCFVAVKTKVAAKEGVDPKPGQRNTAAELPAGSVFEGHVQGLAFRFRCDELVVPMRLSAFNGDDLRNVVYLLADSPKRIRNIPEEYVRRQISGQQLVKNITEPLPLRVLGGTIDDIPDERMERLKQQRDPVAKNGVAARLFVSDVMASDLEGVDELILQEENSEKSLVTINERLGLRGIEIDNLVVEAMNKEMQPDENSLAALSEMTLTVVDGDFPRQVLAGQNLKFDNFEMAVGINSGDVYDSKLNKAPEKREGNLYLGSLDTIRRNEFNARAEQSKTNPSSD